MSDEKQPTPPRPTAVPPPPEPAKKAAKYPPEIRAEAVRRVQAGETQRAVSADLGPSEQIIGRWVQIARKKQSQQAVADTGSPGQVERLQGERATLLEALRIALLEAEELRDELARLTGKG